MQIGLFDILILAGFGLWFLFPIGIYIASHRLYNDTDQSDQFIKTHQGIIGEVGTWEEKVNDWEEEFELEAEIISFPEQQSEEGKNKAA